MSPKSASRSSECAANPAGSGSIISINPAPQPSPSLIVESISDVVEVIDPRGVITYSNLTPDTQGLLGLEPVLGRQCHLVYDKICPSCAQCPLDHVFNTGKRITMECQVSLTENRSAWVRQRLYPISNGNGQVSGVVRMVFDITREKRKQAEEAKYLDSLEQSLFNRESGQPPSLAQALSAREHEVLSYMADGMSNIDIARLLGISPNTVKTHVTHILNRLGAKDRTQAAVTAFRLNLI